MLSPAADRNFDPRIKSLEKRLPGEPPRPGELHGTLGEKRHLRGISRWGLKAFVTRPVLSDE